MVRMCLREAPPGSLLPYRVVFEDQHKLSETGEKTEEYDEIAFKYMYVAPRPLLPTPSTRCCTTSAQEPPLGQLWEVSISLLSRACGTLKYNKLPSRWRSRGQGPTVWRAIAANCIVGHSVCVVCIRS